MVARIILSFIYIQSLPNTQVNIFPVLSHHDERRLYHRRDDQEREHNGEVLPRGMPYMESKERAFRASHPPVDHHTEPKAVGGCDKKRWDLKYPVG